MGWLSGVKKEIGEMKEEIAATKDARDEVSAVPVQRIDTLVVDPISGEQRHRTDYAGTVWYGGRPQTGQPRPAGLAQISNPFWLPDSNMYEPGTATDAQIQASAAVQSAWIQSSGGGLQIFDVNAMLSEDPGGSGALLVALAVAASADLPFGVAYRVTVLCASGGVRHSVAR